MEGYDEEEINKIAFMQSVQEAVHEYIYQFTIAQDTQQKLCEIAYTTVVTIVSTIMSMITTYGLSGYVEVIRGFTLSGFELGASGTLGASTSFISRLGANFISLASRGLNPFLIASACISETAQEIYLDPWIEATMTNLVADAGLGVFWQTFFSGLVEGAREAFMGPIARSAKSSLFDIKNNLRTNQMLDQNQHVMLEQDLTQGLQQQEVSYAKQFAKTSLILFGTLLVSGFLGSLIGPSVGAGLTATVIMFQGDGDRNDDNIKNTLSNIVNEIRSKKTVFTNPNPSLKISDYKSLSLEELKESIVSETSSISQESRAYEKAMDNYINFMRVALQPGSGIQLIEIAPPNLYENRKVNFWSVLRENLMKKGSRVKFTTEIVETVYKYLPFEEKYVVSEVGNVLKRDPVGVVRTALEMMQYQLDPAWYSWGTKIPRVVDLKNINYRGTQYEDILIKCKDAGLELITTKKEWFNLILNKGEKSPTELNVIVKCKNGHETLKNVHAIGRTGCRECYYEKISLSYQDALDLADYRNFELLSDENEFKQAVHEAKSKGKQNGNAILRWKHKDCGYVFENSYKNIQSRASCPNCFQSKNQKITHGLCEHIFGEKFELEKSLVSIFPELITNPKYLKIGEYMSFIHMHIDIYAEFMIDGKLIRLALEYNGEQHNPDPKIGFEVYKVMTQGKGTYKDWQRYLQRDQFKNALFESFNDQGYYLINVPYTVRPYQRQTFIISEFEKQTGIALSYISIIDWKILI